MESKKVKLSHNLSEDQLEETLEKALTTVRKRREDPESPLDEKLSEELRERSFSVFSKVVSNMMEEIKDALEKGN